MDKDGKFWRRVLNHRRQAIADTDTSSDAGFRGDIKLTKKPSQQSQEDDEECCCCRCNINTLDKDGSKKLRRKPCPVPSDTSVLSTYKEQLEAKVLNEEMNERISYDSHRNSKRQVEDLAALVQEFSTYAQSLDIRYKAAERLQKVLKEIVPEEGVSGKRRDPSAKDVPLKIREIQRKFDKNTDVPLSLYKKCDEFNEKYKEHAEATSNFSNFLKNEKLSNGEMRRLEEEYDKLRREFNASKTSVSSQISTIISEKAEIVQSCVGSMLPLLSDMMEQDRDIYNMLSSFTSDSDQHESGCPSCNKARHHRSFTRKKSESRGSCKTKNCALETD